MRCETARRRLPDARAERHVAGCAECRGWLGRVERGRALAGESLAAVPPDLTGRVMAAVRRPDAGAVDARAGASPPAPPSRRPAVRRFLAAAAALALVAGAAAFWLVRSASQPALAQAAEATAEADSARFTFDGEFTVAFNLPAGTEQRLREFGAELTDRIADAARGLDLPAAVPDDLKDLIEERLERAGERLRREYHRLPSLALGGTWLTMSGEGAFAGPDRVRLTGEIAVQDPPVGAGEFELIRVDDDVSIRVEDGGWRTLRRLPAGVFRPIGLGLERLTDWLEEGAPGAERLGEETMNGAAVERFRLKTEEGQGISNRVDVWVGVDDGLVHRILTVHETRRGLADLSGRMDVRLFDHGAPVEIDLPEDPVPADDAGLPAEIASRLDQVDLWFGVDLPGPL